MKNFALYGVILLLPLVFALLGFPFLRLGKAIGVWLEKHRIVATGTWIGCIALVCLLPVANSGFPQAQVQDEFSYLLAADTFARGRLRNPPLPSWQNFETFYVQQQPAYSSVYPPAQGASLALGQVFFGHPYVGVLLTNLLLCACLIWTLSAWLPFRWALAGSVIYGSGIAVTYWTHSYWGGSFAALCGVIAVGGVGRGKLSWTALGLVGLGFSRPYEGAWLGLGLAVVALNRFRPWRRYLPAPLCIFGAGACLWLYYNWQTTGRPLQHPYTLYLSQYMMRPMFTWQEARLIEYNHPEMKRLFLSLFRPDWTGLEVVAWKIMCYLFPFRPETLAGGALAGSIVAWRQGIAWLPGLVALGAIGASLSYWFFPHYAAPSYGVLAVLFALGLRSIWSYRFRGREFGAAIACGMALSAAAKTGETTALALTGYREIRLVSKLRPGLEYPPRSMHYVAGDLPFNKDHVRAELESRQGKHLVFIRYAPHHNEHAEWVYNGADLTRQTVIWAREYRPGSDLQLRKHFADRHCWILEPDIEPIRMRLCEPANF